MIVAIGVDLVEIPRIAALWQKSGEAFLDRIYTAAERTYCLGRSHPEQALAARFAAKEAVMKCLGTGWGQGVQFNNIEVVRQPSGAVAVDLHGRAAVVAEDRGIRRVLLTLSHTDGLAQAFAVAVGEG